MQVSDLSQPVQIQPSPDQHTHPLQTEWMPITPEGTVLLSVSQISHLHLDKANEQSQANLASHPLLKKKKKNVHDHSPRAPVSIN